jgi:DNA-directed RNA polymerase specialized sigma subunit
MELNTPEQYWDNWNKNQNPENLIKAVKQFDGLVDSSISSQTSVNRSLLKSKAKFLVADAIKTYDPSKGTKLSTHVYNYLRPIQRTAKDMTEVSPLSRYYSDEAAQFVKFNQGFLEEYGREPDDTEIMDGLGINEKRLSKLNKLVKYEIPEGQLLGEISQDSEDKDSDKLNLWTEYVYNDLNSTDKKILNYKLGKNGHPTLSNEEIAVKLSLNPVDISLRSQKIAEKILAGVNTKEKML